MSFAAPLRARRFPETEAGMMRLSCVVALAILTVLCVAPSAAQDLPAAEQGVLNLFFDCQGSGCQDQDFFRREVPVVNWVRDREVSDVHVLITSQTTGGGGRMYTLAFIGRGEFEGDDQELTVATAGDATTDEERQAIAGRLKMGLVQYLAGTAAADQIVISLGAQQGTQGLGGPPGPGGSQATSSQDDPWNFWVFRVGGNANLQGESSVTSSNYSGNLSANRTTEAWKFNISGRYSRSEREFVISDGAPPVVSLIEDWSGSSLLVKSLTPQWSIGIRSGAGRSSRRNEDLRWDIAPGIEYNFVPYSESSRRAFTLQALINVRHWDYTEQTIYFKTSETRLAPSLTASLNQIQPRGRTSVSVTGSQYLHDSDLYQVNLNASISVRLFQGFSVNASGFYGLIRDQLFLPAGGATTEDVLLRQRQLETNFNYFVVFGFSYRFGSIFNNVVNPRFGGGGGEGFRIVF
jgi:hypothetical protein